MEEKTFSDFRGSPDAGVGSRRARGRHGAVALHQRGNSRGSDDTWGVARIPEGSRGPRLCFAGLAPAPDESHRDKQPRRRKSHTLGLWSLCGRKRQVQSLERLLSSRTINGKKKYHVSEWIAAIHTIITGLKDAEAGAKPHVCGDLGPRYSLRVAWRSSVFLFNLLPGPSWEVMGLRAP